MTDRLIFEPVWFDSLGAKSACVRVKTPDITVVIDPGVAAMQPGFPGTERQKKLWRSRARRKILEALEDADVVVISHYHHDHYLADQAEAFLGKRILAKNPNEWINESQRGRALQFFLELARLSGLEELSRPPQARKYADPLEALPLSLQKDFGDYNRRRKQLLRKGAAWFKKMAAWWRTLPVIPEWRHRGTEVQFPEGKELLFGKTRIRLSGALFHGIDYSRLGWVMATVIEHAGTKLLHTSDVNGPIIEDYAEWIIRENPDILILDGPATYLFGYLVTRTTLQRAVDNAIEILRRCSCRLIIYDHHLPREPKFLERTAPVWEEARRQGKTLLTAAEYLGKRPKVLEVAEKISTE